MRCFLVLFGGLLVALLAHFILLPGPATAQGPSAQGAGQCSFEGTWRAQGFTTRIDAQRRWSTWSGSSTEGPPQGQGWVLTDNELMTFDHEGAERGYAYVWSFEDDCALLDLRLVRAGGQPVTNGFRIRFNRRR